jgi:hypothetical protein
VSAFLRRAEKSCRNPARDSWVFARAQESRFAGLMEPEGVADSDELVLDRGVSLDVLAQKVQSAGFIRSVLSYENLDSQVTMRRAGV